MTLRILHVGKFFPPYMGGMEVFLADLIEAQRSQGIEAFALVHGTPLPDDPHWLIRVPVQFNLVYAPIAIGFRSALGRAIRTFQPDVLHLHLPNNSALWTLTLPAARKVPCVVHWHSDVVMSDIKWSVALAYFLYRPFEFAILDRAHKVFATSPPYLEASPPLQAWRDKCFVVPLGIKLRKPPLPSSVRSDLSWKPTTKLKLLSIGRLTYYKGFETLIRAVQEMQGVELLIAGEGELHEALQALIQATTPAGGAPAVTLVGSVRDEEKHTLLRECDVFCLASRERTEAFGVVLLEAMQHRRPCIVSDLPGSGMPWVVGQARAGLHVPLEDLESWRSNIARLQHNTRLRMQLGEAGYRVLMERFRIEHCERALAKHYQQVGIGSSLKAGTASRVLVIIATHNHAPHIKELINRARSLVSADILVVDNNSTDATQTLAETAQARVITPLLRMTTWGRLQTGIQHAYASGYESVVTIDAEGRYEVEELPALLAHLQDADVAVAYFSGDHSIARRVAWQWFRWTTRLGMRDFVSGFRAYNRSAMRVAISAEATLLDYQDIGTLLLLRSNGMRLSEVPLSMQTPKTDRTKIFRSWMNATLYVVMSSLLSLAYALNTVPGKKTYENK